MQKQLMHWNERKSLIALYLLIGLYLLLFLPFWKPTLLGFLFAGACAPLVNKVRLRVHAKRAMIAYTVVGLSVTIFVGIVALVVLQGYSQLYELFQDPAAMTTFNDKIGGMRDQFLTWAKGQSYLSSFNVKAQLDRAVIGISNSARGLSLVAAQAFISNAPQILLELFIFIGAFGAFLIIQPRIWASMSEALRLGNRGREHFERFERICGLALGSVILTGVVQAALVTIGAAVAGYNSFFMVFGITLIFAMIPLLGAGLVPFVLAIAGFVSGDVSAGVIMLVTAAIVGIADNILRAYLFSRAAQTNPMISIISLLGGIALMGFAGLFVAPVIEQLVMTYAFSDEKEPKPHQVTATSEKPQNMDNADVSPRTHKQETGQLAPT